MNINDTPQDKNEYKQRGEIRKVIYVTDEDGSYTKTNSEGWDVEDTATKKTWDSVEEELALTKEAVLKGELSPVAYFMNYCLLDLSTLAKYMGMWKWRIKRHLQPVHFKKLSHNILEKYARVFNIKVEELTDFKID